MLKILVLIRTFLHPNCFTVVNFLHLRKPFHALEKVDFLNFLVKFAYLEKDISTHSRRCCTFPENINSKLSLFLSDSL